jgi:ADP-heptose:LPS heptosyltransferase
MVKHLKNQHYDLSLDLRGDLRHHVLLFLAGVRVRIGYGITGGDFLLHRALRLQIGQHEVERNLAVVPDREKIDLPESYTPLVLSEAEQKAARSFWESQAKHIVVHVSAGDPLKAWPISAFAQVCDTLTDHGYEVVLVGTQNETKRVQGVADLCIRPVRSMAGKTTLRELAALITYADLFIGNDSGPGHLAITQGIPAILLWSETNTPEEWGPWGKQGKTTVIRDPKRSHAVAEVVQAAQELLS